MREYLVDRNGTQAAIRAGYSRGTAESQASHLLRNPKVAAAVAVKAEALAQRLDLKAEDVLREFSHIAHMDPGELFDADGKPLPIHKLPEHVRRAIASVEVKKDGSVRVTFWDKTAGLTQLGRFHKLFTDKKEVAGEGGGPLEVRIVSYADLEDDDG